MAATSREFFLEVVGVIGDNPLMTNGWETSEANCKKAIVIELSIVVLLYFDG